MKIDELNVDNLTQMYLEKINILLDAYVLLNRIDECKLKLKPKPLITLGLQNTISVRNKLLTNKFIIKKDRSPKEEIVIKYKKCRNLEHVYMRPELNSNRFEISNCIEKSFRLQCDFTAAACK